MRQAELGTEMLRLHHLPGGRGAGADVPNLALAQQQVERRQGFLDRRIRVWTVRLVQIDGVRAQSA